MESRPTFSQLVPVMLYLRWLQTFSTLFVPKLVLSLSVTGNSKKSLTSSSTTRRPNIKINLIRSQHGFQITNRGKREKSTTSRTRGKIRIEERRKAENTKPIDSFFVYFFCIICSKPKTNKFLNRMHMIVWYDSYPNDFHYIVKIMTS